MATDTGASYATPPRSDTDCEEFANINKESPRASDEDESTDDHSMFFADTSKKPPPARASTPTHIPTKFLANMQLIDAGEKREMALDNIETVLTSEMDERAVATLQATAFETYWAKAETRVTYKRTTYLREVKQQAEYAAEAWRLSDQDVKAARVTSQKAKLNPVDSLAARNPLHMASIEMESRREIRHAEDANYDAHRNKAERLLAQRKMEDAEAWTVHVERKQEAKRAKQEKKNEELLRKSRNRIRNGRVTKRR